MIASLAIAATLAAPVGDQTTIHETYLVGIGRLSCAHWLSTPETKRAGIDWILGYWSGANAWRHPGSNTVGSSTDGEGILAEVNKECAAHPSEALIWAANAVYQMLDRAERR
jgi:hypothetical protein